MVTFLTGAELRWYGGKVSSPPGKPILAAAHGRKVKWPRGKGADKSLKGSGDSVAVASIDQRAEKSLVDITQPIRSLSPDRVQRTAKAIVENRLTLDYMTVAKAMILLASDVNNRHAIEMTKWLGISKQTRYNWLNWKLEEWIETWEQRLRSRIDGAPPMAKRREVISEAEWRWMAQVLRNAPARSWSFRQRTIASAAAKDPVNAHLRKISRVTLWRNRAKLIELGREQQKTDCCVPLAGGA